VAWHSSEGTLGVITGVTLALLPPVGSVQTLLAPFDTVEAAIGAVPRILATGIMPCAVELIEHSFVLVTERLLNKSWPSHRGTASLMLILDGRVEQDTLSQAEVAGSALESAGALDVLLNDRRERQAEMSKLRSQFYEAIKPGTADAFDIFVPRAEIAPHIGVVHGLEEEIGAPIPTYGHAADGNIHSHSLRRALADGVFTGEIPGWKEKSA